MLQDYINQRLYELYSKTNPTISIDEALSIVKHQFTKECQQMVNDWITRKLKEYNDN